MILCRKWWKNARCKIHFCVSKIAFKFKHGFVFSITGTFYGMVNYPGYSFNFNSPTQNVTEKSCLILYYTGSLRTFDLYVNYLDNRGNNSHFKDNDLLQSSVWKPVQVRLHVFILRYLHNSFCVGVCYLLAILLSSMTSHCISGVMVSMLATIAVDRGYEPQSCQTKIKLVFVASPMPLVVSLNPVHGRVYWNNIMW
jgi:hypothetical protein